MEKYNFKIIIEQDEDGLFVAECPALKGCHTQGSTYEEAVRNIKEAIELCLEVEKERMKNKKQFQNFVIQATGLKFMGIGEISVKI